MIKVITHATSARNPVVPFISLVIPGRLSIENTVWLTLRDYMNIHDVAYYLVAVRLHGPQLKWKKCVLLPHLECRAASLSIGDIVSLILRDYILRDYGYEQKNWFKTFWTIINKAVISGISSLKTKFYFFQELSVYRHNIMGTSRKKSEGNI